MNLKLLLQEHKDDVKSVCAKYGATAVRVFGSVARGDFNESSDIDILVRLESGSLKGMRYFGVLEELREELESVLRCAVDLVDESGLETSLPDAVVREAILL